MSETRGVPGPVGTESGLRAAVHIARCPEHGLHGERTECFVCGGAVEQVAMIPASAIAALVAKYQRRADVESTRYCRSCDVVDDLRALAAALPAPVGEGDGLEDLLAAHWFMFERRAYPARMCSCGKWDGAMGDNGGDDDGASDTDEAFLAHLAAQIRAGWVLTPRGGVQGSQGVTEALEGLRTDPSATEAPGEAQIEGKP